MAKDVTRPEPRKLKDEAFIELERMIVKGELEPGRWVSETDLIEISGHTRASVRSAVQRLSNEGLLKTVPCKGAQVCPIDYAQHFRSLELRRSVETLVAKSAAQRATPEQRKKFKEIDTRFGSSSKLDTLPELTDFDKECFSLMIEAAGNEFAARALSSVKGLSRRFWVLHKSEHGDEHKMVRLHAQVAKAIAQGNEDEAEAAVNDLIDYVEQFTLKVIGYNAKSNTNS